MQVSHGSHVPSGHCRNCGYAMDPGRCPECGTECPDISPRPRLPAWAVVCAIGIGLVPAVLAEVMVRGAWVVGRLTMGESPKPDPRDAAAGIGYRTMVVYAVLAVGVVVGLWWWLTRSERVRRVGRRGRVIVGLIVWPLAVIVGFCGLVWISLNLIPW